MTYLQAIHKAYQESLNGYVQHVNQHVWNAETGWSYIVSDWYDCDATVNSFENGKEL